MIKYIRGSSMIKKRKSNIELLRIIATILIIMFHYVYKSNYTYQILNINSFIIKSFYFLGELGVNLFILITGYFHKNIKFSFKKLILLSIEVLFYYLLNIIILFLLGQYKPQNFKSIFLLFFPIILSKYWFITAYILLYLISPYLNIIIDNLSKKKYQKFLILLLTIWSIIPTIFGLFFNSSETLLYYTRFTWLIIIYFTGAYIKNYKIKFIDTKSKNIICIIITTILLLLSIIIIYHNRLLFNKIGTMEISYLWTPNNIIMFILSISIFNYFINLNISYNKIINTLASTSLGIYMIHDGALQNYIWIKIFKTNIQLYTKYYLIHIIYTSIIIFIIGFIIDIIRQILEKNTIDKLLSSKTFNRLIYKLNIIIDKFLNNI